MSSQYLSIVELRLPPNITVLAFGPIVYNNDPYSHTSSGVIGHHFLPDHQHQAASKQWWLLWSENTHRRGKDHCTASLQFNWILFYQTSKYVVIWMYWRCRIQTSQTDTSCSIILPIWYSSCSVTRLGDFLHFGQQFKASGNNYFTQIAHIFRQFL